MRELFRTTGDAYITALYACISKKGNVYYKIFRSHRSGYTEESNNYFSFDEAVKLYILWSE